MNLIAIDPGKTNGWASFSFSTRYQSGQTPYRIWPQLDFTNSIIPITHIILEVDNQQHKVSNFAVYEVEGVVREWAEQHHVELTQQSPSSAMFYFNDERLKERKLYRVGMPHANDAMRHLLYYMQFKARLIHEGGDNQADSE